MTSNEHINLLKDIGGEPVRLDAFYYILEHMNRENKVFYGSHETVSRGIGASLSSVIKAMKKMQSAGYLRQVKNGQWQVTDAIQIFAKDETPEEYKDAVAVEFKNYGSSMP